MCEFCHEHGEGKKWYLKAENYSDDLLGSKISRQSPAFSGGYYDLTV